MIAGLKSELAALRDSWPDVQSFAAGGSAARAEKAARAMDVDVLISIGLAGGLDPSLRCGDVVVGTGVVTADGTTYETDRDWRAHAAHDLAGVGGPVAAAVYGSDVAVTSAADKAALLRRSGAVAVDMESHGVARAAVARGLKLVVLRVIADPADRAIPASALGGMAPDGSTRALPVLGALLLDPREIPAIARLARDSRQAHQALRRVALGLAGLVRG